MAGTGGVGGLGVGPSASRTGPEPGGVVLPAALPGNCEIPATQKLASSKMAVKRSMVCSIRRIDPPAEN